MDKLYKLQKLLKCQTLCSGQYEEVKINLLKKYKHNRKAYTDGKGDNSKIIERSFSMVISGKDSNRNRFKISVGEMCSVYSGYIEGYGDNEPQDICYRGKQTGCVYTGTVTAVIYGQDNTPVNGWWHC